ncbi:sugar transporter [Pseudomonas sp. MMS21-TM103]|uniref:sugar transporter n=1 Tax=Pseudomonas sp. MMS21 TM103 TaxID=2886506 RepID=UPI001EDCB658|nr:sugar transporter [Pseudomonas sp. MMS21 TM103]MCG4455177.1 sugar transporter [Pseudomonas sp. MMS21 TM103]
MNFFIKLIFYVPVKLVPALVGVFFVVFLYGKLFDGQYVNYSISIICSLIAMQLCIGWLANSILYFLPSRESKEEFLFDCIILVILISPVASVIAALIAGFFISGSAVFYCVIFLCLSQIFYFLVSAIFQSEVLIKQQLYSVMFQGCSQILMLLILFKIYGPRFECAIVAMGVGFVVSVIYLFFKLSGIFSVRNIYFDFNRLVSTFNLVFKYGSPLVLWMFGVLAVSGGERFAVSFFNIELGDAYLSLKDLFVGASGLLSMPLLMLVHPIIIDRFRRGYFDSKTIESSIGLLIIVFSLFWTAWQFVGFHLFEFAAGKEIYLPKLVIFIIFVSVFLGCVSIYLQKRLEVHKRISLMARYALFSGLVSIVLSFTGAYFLGLYGIAIGILVSQALYTGLVLGSTFKKLQFYPCLMQPLIISLFCWFLGLIYSLLLDSVFSQAEWHIKYVCWTVGFMVLSVFVLYRGVEWSKLGAARVVAK